MVIKKGDNVIILSGAHKGQAGKVIKVFPKEERIIVEGRNLIKRHQRPSQREPKGGIIEKEGTIHIASVMLVCPKCNAPSRTARKTLEDKRKMRICKKCGEMIE